jgi:pyruvate dehydrogenase E1 component
MSTQFGFGALLNELAREMSALAERIVTTSPDVTVSTNLGPWVNRRRLFARESMADTFKSERIPSTFNWEFSPKGQHIELGIAEMNLFILLSALGLSHSINGERLLPIGTLYDPFIARGLDALNYACYQDARFIVVATPSGLSLAPEGGAHQSIAEPLIGLAQDGLAAFEPGFVDELAVILAFSLDYVQKNGDGDASERNWLRDEIGGSVYLRLSTRPIEQTKRTMTPKLRQAIVDGAYWLREPGPNCQVVVAYSGAVAPEAIQAVGLMAEDRRDVGLLAVTSADRLNAGWTAASRARERGLVHARSHIERLFGDLPGNCCIVSVLDGHPPSRCRAFRSDRFHPRTLPTLRHRHECHHRGCAGDRAGAADSLLTHSGLLIRAMACRTQKLVYGGSSKRPSKDSPPWAGTEGQRVCHRHPYLSLEPGGD